MKKHFAAVLLSGIAWLPMAVTAKPHAPAQTPPAKNSETLSHGRFEGLTVYRPEGPTKSFVMLLSGDAGWNADMAERAQVLVAKGAMVVGINTTQMVAALEKDDGDCVYPDGDLENLGHFVQAYYKLPTYFAPILAGYSTGATLAYASAVQSPPDRFAGVLTAAFRPALAMRKPLCKGDGIEFNAHPDHRGVDFLPAKKLDEPWFALQAAADKRNPLSDAQAFVGKVQNANLIPVAGLRDDAKAAKWATAWGAAYDKLAARPATRTVPAAPASLTGLPIVVVEPKRGAPPSDLFALIISGDGGWAGIDEEVAASLSAKGITVIGLDSLRYFWTPRTPEGLTADIDRIIRYYLVNLKKSRAMLIGYSQGADVTPFILNRLPGATRAQLALSAVMGLSDNALFEFHLSNWVGNTEEGVPTQPEIDKLRRNVGTMPVLCIYGQDDGEALCPKLDAREFQIVKLKGGHHFGGDYDRVAQEILNAVPARQN